MLGVCASDLALNKRKRKEKETQLQVQDIEQNRKFLTVEFIARNQIYGEL